MRTISSSITNLWNQGGPFIGDNGAPHGRVTVEPGWFLHEESSVSTDVPSKLPFRWWQRLDNSQTEVEIPNISTIEIDRTLDADAASCEIEIYNQWMDSNSVAGNSELGSPGYFTWNYGQGDAAVRWGSSDSPWNDILIPNALIRIYQGFGGRSKTITQALSDGNILLTGVFLVDEVRVGTDGKLNLKCRDMMKLLIEQQLFPPLIPMTAPYPLHYYRWKYTDHVNPGVPVYDYTDPIENAPEGWPKYIVDISISLDGQGYWLVGTDGGVFSFNAPFYGSRGTELENAKTSAMCADPLGRGYWLFGEDGGVFTFGEVLYYGDPVGSTVSPIIAAAAHPDGRGYWMVDKQGNVYAFGSAAYHGGNPGGASDMVDIGATLSGNGYWLLDEDGHIYTFGDALYHGGADGPFLYGRAVGLAVYPGEEPDGGYWIVTETGQIWTAGHAPEVQHNGPDWESDVMPYLNDPIFSISPMPTGNGFLLVGGDGGVYSFGDAPFWGSLVTDFTYTTRSDGNYTDYTDIVKDLLRWSGWLAYGDGSDDVYGNLESTGAYSENDLPPDLFDKKPVIDGINSLKEIVGYHLWVDEEGAIHFESPNWYQVGNFDESGNYTSQIIAIDEQYQLTDYAVQYTDTSVRSEIIISSNDPNSGFTDVVTTRRRYENELLRGMIRPAMWVNSFLSKPSEQARMLDQIEAHVEFSFRRGTVQMVANPAIQINDQVRIYERQTGETFVHYVRGVKSSMDLNAGTWLMTLTTNWLGEDWVQ
jgi:hypothetical protein